MKIDSKVSQKLKLMREHPLQPETGAALSPLSQQALGAMLNIAPSTVSQYEATEGREARRHPHLELVERWAEACGYRLQLELVPAARADELLPRVAAATPDKRALVSLFMQFVEQQSPEGLQTIHSVLTALCQSSGLRAETPSATTGESSAVAEPERENEL